MSTLYHKAAQHINEVRLAGNLVRDVELKQTTTGKLVGTFTILTKVGKAVEYTRCTAWEGLAKSIAEKFSKGSFIEIHGRLETRSWDDKQTGQKKYMTQVVVRDLGSDPSGTELAHRILAPVKPEVKNDLQF